MDTESQMLQPQSSSTYYIRIRSRQEYLFGTLELEGGSFKDPNRVVLGPRDDAEGAGGFEVD